MTYFALILLGFNFYLMKRSFDIHKFRIKLIDKVSEVAQECIKNYGQDQDWERAFNWFNQVSFNDMMIRFWVYPLKKFYPQSLEEYMQFPSICQKTKK